MLMLKKILAFNDLTQAELGREVKLSAPTVAQWINHGMWPKRTDPEELKEKVRAWLADCKAVVANDPFAEYHHEVVAQESCNSPEPEHTAEDHNHNEELDLMLLRKQTLSPEARRAFQLFRDPFAEPASSDELFLSPDIRYVREALYGGAKNGSLFAAVVGESGSGKSTIRKDLRARIARDRLPIIVIEPYVLAMEDNDIKGKTLKSAHICEAILEEIAPSAKPARSSEARFRQVHRALRESAKMGNKHLLIIEEAHSLPVPTLKHLKRFFELEAENGFDKLISIVLIGQTELGRRLDERSPEVREVVQRCELLTLNPLGTHLEDYLRHRFELAGKNLDEVVEPQAIAALYDKLTSPGRNGKPGHSVVYPLAVQNVLTAAFNAAADVGANRLSAEIIAEV